MRHEYHDELLGARLAAAFHPTDDDEIADAIRSVPTHYAASPIYRNAQSANGTCVLTQAGAGNVVWNLTALSVSLAGPTLGPNGKVTIYDGDSVTGNVLHAEFLPGPGSGSVGTTLKVSIPVGSQGTPGLQAGSGNAMTIVVTGTGNNQVSINARFTDGLS